MGKGTPRRVLVAIALTTCLTAASQAHADTASERIIYQQRPGLTASQATDLRADADVELDATLTAGIRVATVDTPGDRADALADLRDDARVTWAEPDHVLTAAVTTDDAYFNRQWGLLNTGASPNPDISAADAWKVTDGAGVTVAVTDTGIQGDHPDLAANQAAGSHDYYDNDSTPVDNNGHGTHVAGIIAAADNTIGTLGVAPAAKIRAYKVLGDDGKGLNSTITQGFDDAATAGARIVNASLGGSTYSNAMRTVIASHPNTLYVVAAGNDAQNVDSTPEYPCAYDLANVLCVAAIGSSGSRASFSNCGPTSVDVLAPGDMIYSTMRGSSYSWMSGTSMAAPMVSGIAALLLSRDANLTAAQIKQAIVTGASDSATYTSSAQAGVANALGALYATGAPKVPDTKPPTAPASMNGYAISSDTARLTWRAVTDRDLDHYDLERLAGSTWQPVTSTTATTADVPANAGSNAYRVLAVDTAGNRSQAATTTVYVTVVPPRDTATPKPPSKPDTGTTQRETVASLSALRLSTGRTAQDVKITLSLTDGAELTLRLDRRACSRGRCKYTKAGRTTTTLDAGKQTLRIPPELAKRARNKGRYRLTITAPGGSRTATFTVRARRS